MTKNDDAWFFSVHLLQSSNLNDISEYLKKNGLDAHYDQQDNDIQTMFITFSGKNIILDARDESTKIGLQLILEFIRMNFEKNKQYRHLKMVKMGHGYFSVVGFGCVIEIKKIIETFYDIEYDDDLLQSSNLDDISEYFEKKGLKAHYERQDNDVQNMFITFSGKNITLDARDDSGGYGYIDKSLNPTIEELYNFSKIMSDYGVGEPPRLIVYAYEGS